MAANFARGARTSGASPAEPHGAELTTLLVPSLHEDCDLFGVVKVRGIEYRVLVWRQSGRDGREWLKLRLSPKTARVVQ